MLEDNPKILVFQLKTSVGYQSTNCSPFPKNHCSKTDKRIPTKFEIRITENQSRSIQATNEAQK